MTRTADIQQHYAKLLSAMETFEPECRNNPDLFFPGDTHNQRELSIQTALAKVYCAECPIKIPCAEYAIVAKEPYGIWGGLTVTERGH